MPSTPLGKMYTSIARQPRCCRGRVRGAPHMSTLSSAFPMVPSSVSMHFLRVGGSILTCFERILGFLGAFCTCFAVWHLVKAWRGLFNAFWVLWCHGHAFPCAICAVQYRCGDRTLESKLLHNALKFLQKCFTFIQDASKLLQNCITPLQIYFKML